MFGLVAVHGSLGFAARGRLIADADSDAAAVADFPTEPATLVICAPASSILVLSLAYLTVPSRAANAYEIVVANRTIVSPRAHSLIPLTIVRVGVLPHVSAGPASLRTVWWWCDFERRAK